MDWIFILSAVFPIFITATWTYMDLFVFKQAAAEVAARIERARELEEEEIRRDVAIRMDRLYPIPVRRRVIVRHRSMVRRRIPVHHALSLRARSAITTKPTIVTKKHCCKGSPLCTTFL